MQRLTLPEPLTLQLKPFHFVAITLVGCGGTGSHLAGGLVPVAQQLAERQVHVEMVFQDPDTVVEKNIGRQLFAPRDLGRNKAEALASRLNGAYGLSIGALTRPIAGAADTFLHPDADLNLVIGCVDNAGARAVMRAAVESAAGRLWWLDAGNENHSGQVALGNTTDAKRFAGAVALGLVGRLPAPSLLYPDLCTVPTLGKLKPIKAKSNGRAASCADLVETGEQGLMVNRMAAAWALSLLHDFLLGDVHYMGLAFDLKFGGVKSYALDLPTLAEVVGMSEARLMPKPEKEKTQ